MKWSLMLVALLSLPLITACGAESDPDDPGGSALAAENEDLIFLR